MKPIVRIALAGLIATLITDPAHAENLVVSVSNHRVTITPNYAGEELVLFGAVERDNKFQPERSDYDLVVTVKGPDINVVTRRKERKLGLWINVDSREFIQAPAYLGVFSNKPIDAIASPELQSRQQLGLNNILLRQRIGPDTANVVTGDSFRAAFIRLRKEKGLYREQISGVTFLTPRLFRAGITVPEEVATGIYIVEIKLFAAGAMISKTETAFEIVKVGFEQFVANSARQHGLLYGLATALMALITGWLAFVAFQRD